MIKKIKHSIKCYFFLQIKKMQESMKVYDIEILKEQLKKVGTSFEIDKSYSIKNPQYISIGDKFSAMWNLRIEAWDSFEGEKFQPEINIGNKVIMNTDVHISAINKIHIGNNVLMASRIYISDHSHGDISNEALQLSPAKRNLFSKGPVIIEDNVWIGEGVVILPNVTIGKNSIIGANSVVNKDVQSNCVVAGVPAIVIKKL